MTVISETLSGLEGWWLRNGVAEAFVSAKQGPRLAEFRLRDRTSLMIPGRFGRTFFGVRTCYMEPKYNAETSSRPNQCPANARVLDTHTLQLEGQPDELTELQLIMEFRLDEHVPRLTIRHGMKNLSRRDRRLALWSLTVVPPQGVGLVPWRREEGGTRSYLFFFATDPREPSLKPGANALGVDFRTPPQHSMLKVGTNSDAGWTAYLSDDQALVSSVAFQPGAEYPENDSIVTFFASDGTVDFSDEVFCELENLGPLTAVSPGQTVWMEQRLDILHGVSLSSEDADSWMDTLVAAGERVGLSLG